MLTHFTDYAYHNNNLAEDFKQQEGWWQQQGHETAEGETAVDVLVALQDNTTCFARQEEKQAAATAYKPPESSSRPPSQMSNKGRHRRTGEIVHGMYRPEPVGKMLSRTVSKILGVPVLGTDDIDQFAISRLLNETARQNICGAKSWSSQH